MLSIFVFLSLVCGATLTLPLQGSRCPHHPSTVFCAHFPFASLYGYVNRACVLRFPETARAGLRWEGASFFPPLYSDCSQRTVFCCICLFMFCSVFFGENRSFRRKPQQSHTLQLLQFAMSTGPTFTSLMNFTTSQTKDMQQFVRARHITYTEDNTHRYPQRYFNIDYQQRERHWATNFPEGFTRYNLDTYLYGPPRKCLSQHDRLPISHRQIQHVPTRRCRPTVRT